MTIGHDDVTPTDRKTPFEMVLEKLGEVGADAKLAVTEARDAKGHAQNTYNLQLDLNERFKGLEARVKVVERTHIWLPLTALVLAAVALVRAW